MPVTPGSALVVAAVMAGSLRGWHVKISIEVFAEDDLKTIHDLYKALGVNKTT